MHQVTPAMDFKFIGRTNPSPTESKRETTRAQDAFSPLAFC